MMLNDYFQKVQPLGRYIPTGIRRSLKKTWQDYVLGQSIRLLKELPAGQVPSCELLEDLQAGWGNETFVAKVEYLQLVAERAMQTKGPILECGSGLTTVLLGILAGKRGISTYSLEHTPEWHQRVRSVLQRFRISNAQVCMSPLKDYGSFTWYTPPADLPSSFSLVICDGPPGSTPGGRFGLQPVLGHHLTAGTMILLDDAEREGEVEVIQRWKTYSWTDIVLHKASRGMFATVTVAQ